MIKLIVIENKFKDIIIKKLDNTHVHELLLIVPSLHIEVGFDQKNPHHHLDVFNHTLLALSYANNDYIINTVLLFHDIGKPKSFALDKNGIGHFNNHALHSVNITKPILENLNFEKEEIDYILKLILYHDEKIPIESSSFKLFVETHGLKFIEDLLNIQYCDALAHNPKYVKMRIDYLDVVRNNLRSINNRRL